MFIGSHISRTRNCFKNLSSLGCINYRLHDVNLYSKGNLTNCSYTKHGWISQKYSAAGKKTRHERILVVWFCKYKNNVKPICGKKGQHRDYLYMEQSLLRESSQVIGCFDFSSGCWLHGCLLFGNSLSCTHDLCTFWILYIICRIIKSLYKTSCTSISQLQTEQIFKRIIKAMKNNFLGLNICTRCLWRKL